MVSSQFAIQKLDASRDMGMHVSRIRLTTILEQQHLLSDPIIKTNLCNLNILFLLSLTTFEMFSRVCVYICVHSV